MLKPQDVLVTLKLASATRPLDPRTFASLAESLSMSASEVFAATRRSAECHLLVEERKPGPGSARYRPVIPNLREFLVSGLRYVFPGEFGKIGRGVATAHSASPLDSQLSLQSGDLPIVWAHSDGDKRGISLKPLYRSAPDAALRDSSLYAWLALADALRTGDARIRSLAAAEIDRLIANQEHGRTR